MHYYEHLDLTKEPFSNSPDPSFFFRSRNHVQCLNRLEIAIRLRRGLNVCLGEVGTGKSTLSRALIQRLSEEAAVGTYLILDPSFSSAKDFLRTLHKRFLGIEPRARLSNQRMMEALNNDLFQKAVDRNMIVLLIIDEGQKLEAECLEVLRVLLNYETNAAKLLQVVIFAQEEFAEQMAAAPNFQDRVNEVCRLAPLGFRETRALIRHRLKLAGARHDLFSGLAYWAMFTATRGRPRRIMHLGHKVLLYLVAHNRKRAGMSMVRRCAKPLGWDYRPPILLRLAFPVILMAIILLPRAVDHGSAIQLMAGGPANHVASPLPLSQQREPISSPPLPRRPAPETQGTLNSHPKSTHDQDSSPPLHPSPPAGLPTPDASPPPEPESSPSFPDPISRDTAQPALPTQADHALIDDAATPGSPDMPIQRFSGSRFYVQVGGFLSSSNARRMLASLSADLDESAVVEVDYKDRQWYVVHVGSFADVPAARQHADHVAARFSMEAVVVEIVGSRYRFVNPED
ncbi:AAA family ATPase [Desulfonatronum thioautotrophicum]|uniref:AAA family ATPase n=1 Tax=Desulfonatronum thioautotrophicum TaxID=617001 RepID=UPI00069ABBAA|nr:AAA family ATPase [Desulfonatronum thioautotrophicum]